jgi:hypothetical protein
MSINNPERFLAGFWDWGFLDKCFGGKIKVSDLDGIVERRGHFLVLETKKKGVSIPSGQRIMFERMAKTGLITVIVIWGDKNATEEIQIYYPGCEAPTPKKAATNEDVQHVAEWWNNYVNNIKVFNLKGDDIAVYAIVPANASEIANVERILTAGVQHLMNLGHEQELRRILAGLQKQLEKVS